MEKENRLYSISLGVASLQGGSVGVATALSPATCRPFQVFSPSFFVGLGLIALVVLCREEICSKENHSALSRCFFSRHNQPCSVAEVALAIGIGKILAGSEERGPPEFLCGSLWDRGVPKRI